MNRGTHRLLLLTVLMTATATFAGCATKKDIRLMRDEMAIMRAHQDSLNRETQRQTKALLDTLRLALDVSGANLRGETATRFQSLNENLQSVEASLNQLQRLVSQLLASLDRQQTQMATAPTEQPRQQQPSMAEDLYQQGMGFVADSSFAAARIAFEEVVAKHPNDPRAPDAQFAIGEAYYAEKNPARAIASFDKLERTWKESPRAPEALLRAGVIAQEQKQNAQARRYYEAVRARYPTSEAAEEAQRLLRGLPRE